jgi:hypothetical protein
VRYQAALRPEPLGSNTRTIASQPTIARMSFFFDETTYTSTRAALDHQKLACPDFRSRSVEDINRVPRRQ